MSVVRALCLLWWGCSGGGATLRLDGPEEVRVEQLGPVSAPAVALSDGGQPDVAWAVDPASAAVARVEQGQVHAVGEGSAVVTGTWQGQSVHWTLQVDPAWELAFTAPPAELAVGAKVDLVVGARRGGRDTPAVDLVFTSSDPAILEVSATGSCTGVAPGVAYVTATGHGGNAMAEIAVRPE